MHHAIARQDPNTVTARIVWPVALILLSVLALAVGGLAWTGHRTNEQAAERQRASLETGLRMLEGQTLLRLQRVVTTPEAQAALDEPVVPDRLQLAIGPALESFGFDRSFIVTPQDTVVSGRAEASAAGQGEFDAIRPMLQPALEALRHRLAREDLRRSIEAGTSSRAGLTEDFGEIRLVYEGGRALLVAVTAVAPPSETGAFGPLLAVAIRPLSPDLLRHMAVAIATEGLALQGLPVPGGKEASLVIADAQGRPAGALVWTPDRPGDAALLSVLPVMLMAVAGIGLFAGFMFAHVRGVTIDLVAREAQATHLALHDPLSGLPNRSYYQRRLDIELSRLSPNGDGIAVMLLDLDRFKEINDTWGHAAGDVVIGEVAKRLQEALRGSDALARLGGDEFAILQTRVRTHRDCVSLARRVLDHIREPIELGGLQVFVGVSIGIALAPQNSTDRDTLVKQADAALYRAKHEGRNRFSFFEIGLDAAQRRRAAVEEDLRGAIARDELSLVYQPQFSSDGQRVLGVEALVRWTHPRQGSIPPSDFIPIAEERGLVSQLGEWVLRHACRQARAWNGLTVAVNVSPIQFRQRDFVSSVARIIAEEGLDPGRLELEITEGVIMDDEDMAEEAMMELRAMGVRFALDDFGTGYSSLIYLRRFAFDKIKIDRSFLEAMESTGESAILVHSVVHLGRALGLTVVAEGVETPEQHRFLQAVGCHQLQGYLFSRPLEPGEIDVLVAARNGVPDAPAGKRAVA